MTKIAIIAGSTRPGRRARTVAEWAHTVACHHPAVISGSATADLIDLADHDLPLLDEPVAAMFGQYRHPHTARWASTIEPYDGFVFVTAEYNRSVPAALKNAIDYLFVEWNHKVVGFVSYGVNGGVRAVEHLRLTMAAVKAVTVPSQLALSVIADFEPSDPTNPDALRTLRASERHLATLTEMLDEIISWAGPIGELRTGSVTS